MTDIKCRKGEPIERALRRLKKKLDKGWGGCGAVRSVSRGKDRIKLVKNPYRNKNVYWGIQKSGIKLNVSSCPNMYLTVRSTKLTSGKAELLVRVFSGNRNVFEASGSIRTGTARRIRMDLSGWKYKNNITKIQILIKRESGNWAKGAGAVFEKIGFG